MKRQCCIAFLNSTIRKKGYGYKLNMGDSPISHLRHKLKYMLFYPSITVASSVMSNSYICIIRLMWNSLLIVVEKYSSLLQINSTFWTSLIFCVYRISLSMCSGPTWVFCTFSEGPSKKLYFHGGFCCFWEVDFKNIFQRESLSCDYGHLADPCKKL